MPNQIQKILKESQFSPEKKDLSSVLWQEVYKKIVFFNKVKLAVYSSASLCSCIISYIYGKALYAEIADSSLSSYLLLIRQEDMTTLLSLWKEVAYTLVESVPTFEVTLLLGVIFILFITLNGAVLSLRKRSLFSHHY